MRFNPASEPVLTEDEDIRQTLTCLLIQSNSPFLVFTPTSGSFRQEQPGGSFFPGFRELESPNGLRIARDLPI